MGRRIADDTGDAAIPDGGVVEPVADVFLNLR
jgi:hypothetical protein